ncbi:MAG: hypothetical protein HYR70_11280 [Chloroflexi bacterium]|nr:hypothetical protein [Chloroflexota bacterium]MBI1856310.1 hypothetical protein [Chloroflexota bacterium]MBI3341393.1 hypothetical protein [Chloroflexota bacterium]
MKKLILSAWLLVLLVACTAKYNIQPTLVRGNQVKDGGLLTKKPCGPPCFFGITPVITDEEQATKTMEKMPDIFANCKSFDFTSTGGKRGTNCTYVNIGYKNAVVDLVSFTPSDGISVGQVIDLYGSPNSVSVGIVSLPDSPDRTTMTLFFDQIQTMIGMGEQSGPQFAVQPITSVVTVVYLSKNGYEESRNTPTNQKWNGYGVYTGTR